LCLAAVALLAPDRRHVPGGRSDAVDVREQLVDRGPPVTRRLRKVRSRRRVASGLRPGLGGGRQFRRCGTDLDAPRRFGRGLPECRWGLKGTLVRRRWPVHGSRSRNWTSLLA
jgi:hypothetical protein